VRGGGVPVGFRPAENIRCNEYFSPASKKMQYLDVPRASKEMKRRLHDMSTATSAPATTTWNIDPAHSSAEFKVKHMMISNVKGSFSGLSGVLTEHAVDSTLSSVEASVPVATLSTGDAQRDGHLKSADFFDAEKYPTLDFKSTQVAGKGDAYEVTGDLTMHGVTKPITIRLKGGDKEVEFPKGTKRVGVVSTFSVIRSEFGVTAEIGNLGDEIPITIGIQASK